MQHIGGGNDDGGGGGGGSDNLKDTMLKRNRSYTTVLLLRLLPWGKELVE